mmetsp:Transcript_109498/g.244386  ORF Transcript_109498/g.244386 Transcript_109498/m.244386 type:complete len:466 (+) Transcript_109498:2-1399(+)
MPWPRAEFLAGNGAEALGQAAHVAGRELAEAPVTDEDQEVPLGPAGLVMPDAEEAEAFGGAPPWWYWSYAGPTWERGLPQLPWSGEWSPSAWDGTPCSQQPWLPCYGEAEALADARGAAMADWPTAWAGPGDTLSWPVSRRDDCNWQSRPSQFDGFAAPGWSARAGRSHTCVPKRVNLEERFLDSGGDKQEAVRTLMIRNVPNQYHRGMLMQELDVLGFRGKYDFVYLPIDNSTRWNVGYAFVNFDDPADAAMCMKDMQGHEFHHFRPGKKRVAQVSVAHIQGLEQNLAHCQGTSVFSAAQAPWLRPWVRKKSSTWKAPGQKQPPQRRKNDAEEQEAWANSQAWHLGEASRQCKVLAEGLEWMGSPARIPTLPSQSFPGSPPGVTKAGGAGYEHWLLPPSEELVEPWPGSKETVSRTPSPSPEPSPSRGMWEGSPMHGSRSPPLAALRPPSRPPSRGSGQGLAEV